MEVERDKLINELRTVEVGVAPKKTVEQSDCFVFRKGEVMTYNDEVACHTDCSLSITGAIHAETMLRMLMKWPEKTITFKRAAGQLKFKGKGRRGHFKTEDKITLPIQDVETPKKWQEIPKGFIDAITQVSGCYKRSAESPHLCCINFTPKWIEACDGAQAGRCVMATPFKSPTLLKGSAVKQITALYMTHIGFTDNWVHFKAAGIWSEAELVISCHVYIDEYPSDDLTAIFKTKASPATLPAGLKEMVDRLTVFADTDASQWLEVEVTADYVKVTGQGSQGSQTERKKIKYEGKPVGFRINPQLLRELTDKNDKCSISDKVIKVQKGAFEYITSVWVPIVEEE